MRTMSGDETRERIEVTDDFRWTMSNGEFESKLYDGEKFPDKVIVSGPIFLCDIVHQPYLPIDLIVQGSLTIENCKLEKLPDVLHVDGADVFLTIKNSTLKHMSEQISVSGALCIESDTEIECINVVDATLYINENISVIGVNLVIVRGSIPENIILQLPGRRIEELIDHWMLDVSGIRGRLIKFVYPSHSENKISVELER